MASVSLVESDVAEPPTSVSPSAGVPICVPAVPSQPPLVTSDGWQRKNFTVPVGTGPFPAVTATVAVSETDVPGTTSAACVEDAVVTPIEQRSTWPTAKSCNWAVVDWDERVSAMNVPAHTRSSSNAVASMPPSKKAPRSYSWLFGFPAPVYGQGGSSVPPVMFTVAHAGELL